MTPELLLIYPHYTGR